MASGFTRKRKRPAAGLASNAADASFQFTKTANLKKNGKKPNRAALVLMRAEPLKGGVKSGTISAPEEEEEETEESLSEQSSIYAEDEVMSDEDREDTESEDEDSSLLGTDSNPSEDEEGEVNVNTSTPSLQYQDRSQEQPQPLKARLSAFLPQLAAANDALPSMGAGSHGFEIVSNHIERGSVGDGVDSIAKGGIDGGTGGDGLHALAKDTVDDGDEGSLVCGIGTANQQTTVRTKDSDAEQEQYIEMELSLGVLEQLRNGENSQSSSEPSSEDDEDGGDESAEQKQKVPKEKDVLGKLLFGKTRRRHRAGGIVEIGREDSKTIRRSSTRHDE